MQAALGGRAAPLVRLHLHLRAGAFYNVQSTPGGKDAALWLTSMGSCAWGLDVVQGPFPAWPAASSQGLGQWRLEAGKRGGTAITPLPLSGSAAPGAALSLASRPGSCGR